MCAFISLYSLIASEIIIKIFEFLFNRTDFTILLIFKSFAIFGFIFTFLVNCEITFYLENNDNVI